MIGIKIRLGKSQVDLDQMTRWGGGGPCWGIQIGIRRS